MSQVYKKMQLLCTFCTLKNYPFLAYAALTKNSILGQHTHTMISCAEMEQNAQRTFPEVRNKSDARIKADSTDAIRVGPCDLN